MKTTIVTPNHELELIVNVDYFQIIFKDNNTANDFFNHNKEIKINSNLYKLSINDNIIRIYTVNKDSTDFIALYKAIKHSIIKFNIHSMYIELIPSEEQGGLIVSFDTKNNK